MRLPRSRPLMARPGIDVELVARLHREGRSAAEISALAGCTTRSVTRWRTRTGNRVSQPKPPHPLSDRETARRLIFEDGCSIAEAARTVDAARDTIERWFPDAPKCSPETVIELSRIGRQFAALERATRRRAA